VPQVRRHHTASFPLQKCGVGSEQAPYRARGAFPEEMREGSRALSSFSNNKHFWSLHLRPGSRPPPLQYRFSGGLQPQEISAVSFSDYLPSSVCVCFGCKIDEL
jgi:hypothetical protein